MKTPSFFDRSELTQVLWSFRREFLIVGLFSMVANVLMLSPTLYMLQVYDRVMLSRSELTLLAMSLITLFLFGVMAFAEWMRSRVLVRAGVQLDAALGLTEQGLKSVVVASLGHRSEQDFNASLNKSRLPAEQLFTRL